MFDDFNDLGGDFNPTPEQCEELKTLNEIRDCIGDDIGEELIDRIAVLQGATPGATKKNRKRLLNIFNDHS